MKKSIGVYIPLFLILFFLNNNAYASSENELTYQADNNDNLSEENNISQNKTKKSKGFSSYFDKSKASKVKRVNIRPDDYDSYNYNGSSNDSDSSILNNSTDTTSNCNNNQTSNYATLPDGKAYVGVSSYLSLRDEPFGKVITRLYNNEEIIIVNRDGDWYEVETDAGSGWVYGKCVYDSPNSNPNVSASNVISETDNDEIEEVDDDDDENSNKNKGIYHYFSFSNPGDYNLTISSTSSTSSQKTKETINNKKSTKSNSSKNKTTTSKSSNKDNSSSKNKNKTASSKNTNNKSNTDVKPLLKLSKINISDVLTKTVGNTWDEKGHNYTHVQGFCTDGEYWYIALMTSTNGDGQYYTKQETKLLKIDIKTKKVVKTNKIGKVGHSNSLTYNPITKKIYSATCTKKMSYIYSFNASDLKGKKKIHLKNQKGKAYTNNNFASFTFNPLQNEYIVKLSNKSLGYFDSNFTLKKKVSVKHLKKNDKMTGQAISCDGYNIFSVYNNLSCNPRINYIRIYDMNGKYIKDLTFKSSIGSASERPEMEQLTCFNGKYWSLSNVNGKFRIHKIKLRG